MVLQFPNGFLDFFFLVQWQMPLKFSGDWVESIHYFSLINVAFPIMLILLIYEHKAFFHFLVSLSAFFSSVLRSLELDPAQCQQLWAAGENCYFIVRILVNPFLSFCSSFFNFSFGVLPFLFLFKTLTLGVGGFSSVAWTGTTTFWLL